MRNSVGCLAHNSWNSRLRVAVPGPRITVGPGGRIAGSTMLSSMVWPAGALSSFLVCIIMMGVIIVGSGYRDERCQGHT